MPWTPEDADRFKKGLSDVQKRQWAHVANGALDKCVKAGGSEKKCAARAVMMANGVVGTPKDKEMNKNMIQQVLQTLIEAVNEHLGKAKEKDAELPVARQFMVWKSADGQTYRWLARYSNNIRDRDNPPEIISAASHQRFVELVDKGKAPMPELWLWHRPEWKLGKATWVAYDDAGFALAAGDFDKGKEAAAQWLADRADFLTSHGMPTTTIRRDPEDPTIIVEHETREISPLPGPAAANDLTGFVVLGVQAASKEQQTPSTQEVDTMSIPKEKINALIEQWGADPTLLETLQEINARDAQKAAEEGRESKEIDESAVTDGEAVKEQVESQPDLPEDKDKALPSAADVPAASEEEEVPLQSSVTQPVAEQAEQPVAPVVDYATRQEMVEAILPFAQQMEVIGAQVASIASKLEAMSKELTGLKESDNAKIEKAVSGTPAASVAAILAQRLSVVGSPETQIDGRTSLAKSKPKEAAPLGKTGIPMIDRMLATPDADSA